MPTFSLYSTPHSIRNPDLINEEIRFFQYLEESENILSDNQFIWDLFLDDWHLEKSIIENMILLGKSSLVSNLPYNCLGWAFNLPFESNELYLTSWTTEDYLRLDNFIYNAGRTFTSKDPILLQDYINNHYSFSPVNNDLPSEINEPSHNDIAIYFLSRVK